MFLFFLRWFVGKFFSLKRQQKTKVIVLLNSDLLQTIQTKNTSEEPFYTLHSDSGHIALKSETTDPNVSIVSKVDENLLSYVMGIIMKYPYDTVVMLKQNEMKDLKDEIEEEEIYVNKPSRAERGYLEERI
eukprot:gene11801-5135_t